MKKLDEITSCEVRRTTFSLQHGGDYYIAFSVIEVMEPDMQDIGDFPPQKNGLSWMKRAVGTSQTNNYNVYMTVDKTILTSELVKQPERNFTINGTLFKIFSDSLQKKPEHGGVGYVLKDSFADEGGTLQRVLPLRQCSKIVTAYVDKARLTQSIIMKDENIVKQLSQLSLDRYGVDLTLFPDHLGNIYFVQYNPCFRTVDFSSSYDPKGLYLSFRFRPHFKGQLTIRVSNKNKAGYYLDETDFRVDNNRSEYFFGMSTAPDVIDLKVFDCDGTMVFYQNDIHFIRQIHVNTRVKSTDVKLITKTKDGDKEEIVEKFVSENSVMGNLPEDTSALDEKSAANAYLTLEKRLEFVLFDGDKEKKSENVAKAKEMVKRILTKAQKRCYICDPYFNLQNMIDFVFTMPQLNVDVRVLSCQEFLAKNAVTAKETAKVLDDAISRYNKKVGGIIQMRLLTGQSPLHDRFIVCDDDVWLLGSSFNEFGNRATTIVKVPAVSCPQMYTLAEKWWFDDKLSTSLIDYANS